MSSDMNFELPINSSNDSSTLSENEQMCIYLVQEYLGGITHIGLYKMEHVT